MTKTPMKNIYEEKTVPERSNERKQTTERKIAKKLDAQPIVVRKKYKEHYYKNHFSKIQPSKTKSNSISRKKKVENYTKTKKRTVLIVGDSMLNGIEESKLSKARQLHVQPIPGGKIDDTKKNINLLHEELQKVVIHVGTNNAMTDTSKKYLKN